MKGLELAYQYYETFGKPMIKEKFPAYQDRIAVGLVGDGSECFGFDDETSQDHDWGAGFCLWLTKEDFQKIGQPLQQAYQMLPDDYLGFPKRKETEFGDKRVGVFEIKHFYLKFLGIDHVPNSFLDWRRIPESYLAAATNGTVFVDPLGEFTSFRKQLLDFYPEDIRIKKIAARCMYMAQAGQYNYMRCVKRKEYVAAHCALAEFMNMGISMMYLCNKRYKPFYKWMHRGLKDLPIMGEKVHGMFQSLANCSQESNAYEENFQLIEQICRLVIEILNEQNLSEGKSDFLLDHGPLVQQHIQDPQLKSLPVMAE